MAASKDGGYSGSKGPTNKGSGAPKSHRASQSPPNPFRPGLASPVKSPGGSNFRSRHQNPMVLRSSAPGKQLAPISSGKAEFRLKNKNGFGGIKRDREDKPRSGAKEAFGGG